MTFPMTHAQLLDIRRNLWFPPERIKFCLATAGDDRECVYWEGHTEGDIDHSFVPGQVDHFREVWTGCCLLLSPVLCEPCISPKRHDSAHSWEGWAYSISGLLVSQMILMGVLDMDEVKQKRLTGIGVYALVQ